MAALEQRCSERAGSKARRGMDAPTATAVQAATCTRSSGRWSATRRRRTWRRSFPPGRSASPLAASRRGSSTMSPSRRATRCSDAEWYRDTLGYRFIEYTLLNDDSDVVIFTMVTTNEKSHDLGLVGDFSGIPGRLHHLAFWVDTVEDVLRAADVLMESGVHIEFGPGRHGMGEQTYLYFREPGGICGSRVNSGGYRNYQPDWEPVKWVPSQGSNTMYRNLHMPDSMMAVVPGRGRRRRAQSRRSRTHGRRRTSS